MKIQIEKREILVQILKPELRIEIYNLKEQFSSNVRLFLKYDFEILGKGKGIFNLMN